jgi:hypothetical protein
MLLAEYFDVKSFLGYDTRIHLTPEAIEKRIAHSVLVGRLMYRITSRLQVPNVAPLDALILGILHDIGYSPLLGYRKPRVMDGKQIPEDNHALLGAFELERLGLNEFIHPVLCHGTTLEELEVLLQREILYADRLPFLCRSGITLDKILLWADMHTALDQPVTYAGRMAELHERFGHDPTSLKWKQIQSAKQRWDPVIRELDKLLGLQDQDDKRYFLEQTYKGVL